MSDFIRITFSETEAAGRDIQYQASGLYHTLDRFQNATSTLLNSGLQGAFLDDYYARYQAIVERLRWLCDESDEAGRDLLTVTEWFRRLDAECSALLGESNWGGIFSWFPIPAFMNPMSSDGSSFRGFAGGGGGGGGGGAWGGEEEQKRMNFSKSYPYHMLGGFRRQQYAGIMSAYGPFSDAQLKQFKSFLEQDPFEVKPKYYIDADAEWMWFNSKASGELAAWDASLTSQLGTFSAALGKQSWENEIWGGVNKDGVSLKADTSWTASDLEMGVSGDRGSLTAKLGTSEYSSGASLSLGPQGLKSKANFEIGEYLGKVEATIPVAGGEAVLDGYVGANVTGKAEATFSPMTGDMGASTSFEAFAGGRASAEYHTDLGAISGLDSVGVGMQGAVSYGLGAKFDADLGVKDGVFRADLNLGATVGLGAEFGIKVEFDVNKFVTEDVHQVGKTVSDIGMELANLFSPRE